MSLAPGEQRTLTEIEDRLRKSDPRLAAMFGLLASRGNRAVMQPARAKEPALAKEPGTHDRKRVIILAVIGVTLIIFCIAMAVTSASHAPRASGGHGSGVNSASVYPSGRLWSGRLASSR